MNYVRGSAITFRATCSDAKGQPLTPTQAMLTLSYVSTAGVRVRQDVPMALSGPTVLATWDSSQASDSMPVNWHIRASDAAGGKVAQDGRFVLSAAEANPVYP